MADNKPKGMTVVIGLGGAKPRGGLPPLNAPGMRRQHSADVEAAFTGRPQPHGTYDPDDDGGQVSAETAGYMELQGAQKSGDCNLVIVSGGVSGDLGCCNLFDPQPTAQRFACGECVHYESGSQPAVPAAAPEAMNA